jgi:hypothetical protein
MKREKFSKLLLESSRIPRCDDIARWVLALGQDFQLGCTLLDTGRQSVTVSESG